MSINKVILVGNIGHTPEIRFSKEGNEIATFTLATSESWKDKQSGEKKEMTEWHNIVVFSSSLVNFIKNYIEKGDKLYIEGSLKTNKYKGKDGTEKYSTKIVLQGYHCKLQKLNFRKTEKTDSDDNSFVDEIINDEDIPF